MDWTMIANAEDSLGRIRTLYYLLHIRYETDAGHAGQRLRRENETNALCRKLMTELRSELEQATGDLGMGQVFSDSEARSYFKDVLDSYSAD